jgi:xanthine dehydrogenase accessory factor
LEAGDAPGNHNSAMRELAPTLLEWIAEGKPFALATVVHAQGSAPRPSGSAMAVRADGLLAGSVSGGCVEGAVAEAAQRVMRTGRPELLEFGPETEAVLFEVGLSCGGQIRVLVEPAPSDGSLQPFLHRVGTGQKAERLLELPEGGSFELRVPAAPRLIVVGAVHISVALVSLAKELGFRTVVVDPRTAFAVSERFPVPPDELHCAWPEPTLEKLRPGPGDAVVALSHDPKLDDPALIWALRAGVGYVGALGSARTQDRKRAALREGGLSEDEIARVHGPVGLDIGAATPEEIALSILAEIVRERNKP